VAIYETAASHASKAGRRGGSRLFPTSFTKALGGSDNATSATLRADKRATGSTRLGGEIDRTPQTSADQADDDTIGSGRSSAALISDRQQARSAVGDHDSAHRAAATHSDCTDR